MKKILGLDLGCNSIGWALVNEAENTEEISSIIKLGVRVNPLTVDEMQNFEKHSATRILRPFIKHITTFYIKHYYLSSVSFLPPMQKMPSFVAKHAIF